MSQSKILPPGTVLAPVHQVSTVPASPTPTPGTAGDPPAARPARPRGNRGAEAGGQQRGQSGRFQTLNAFVDGTMRELEPREAQAWLVLYRDTRPDGIARTGHHDMAARMGCSVATVKRILLALTKRGLVHQAFRGGPGRGPNGYRIQAEPGTPGTPAAAP